MTQSFTGIVGVSGPGPYALTPYTHLEYVATETTDEAVATRHLSPTNYRGIRRQRRAQEEIPSLK